MTARRKALSRPDTDALTRRFSMGGGEPSQPAPAERKNTTPGMTRRTYYYATDVADALADVVDRIHYDSRGAIPKHEILAEIIRTGIVQADRIEARLRASHQ